MTPPEILALRARLDQVDADRVFWREHARVLSAANRLCLRRLAEMQTYLDAQADQLETAQVTVARLSAGRGDV